jgi:glycerophosphoryl diester phosphodiesterase
VDLDKMLSHRLRGFGRFENSGAGLRAACASDVRWLELDTRVSIDGEVFVYHNASIRMPGSRALPFSTTPGSVLSTISYPDGQPLLSLKAATEKFARLSGPTQKLCIDIKDAGFESVHLKLVQDAGIENRVVFISWIPQTILRLHDLGTTAPLILSYVSALDLGVVGKWVVRWLAHRRYQLGHFAVIGAETAAEHLGNLAHGFQHAMLCQHLPPPILSALHANRGGVCVHRSFVGPRLSQYCREMGLQLWTFSVRTSSEYIRYASRPDIDVVFCDDAPEVWRKIAANE